jgi:serine/threonine protein kinase
LAGEQQLSLQTKTLGRYRILGELGRGAMGAVYRAADPFIDREVAIKTLLPNLPAEIMREVRERFLREARSAGRLTHPNIVTIFDVGEHNGIGYIAMELLEGQSLAQIMREPQRIAFDAVADIAAQVADALDHAQRFQIVHRDIKPANVMVLPSGRCKLMDFGVAYVPTSTMTQTGAALGSPRYMSPEQVTGVPVDGRSDIFSLGVVLYEMLARVNPFERPGDTTPFPVMHRIAGEAHKPLREVDPKIPSAFDRILDRALAKKPEKRYQRAAEMANDLRRAMPETPARESASEKTVFIGGRPIALDSTKTDIRNQLIDDLEDFAKRVDDEQAAEMRAADAEALRKQKELMEWGAAEERKREEFEAMRTGTLNAPDLARAHNTRRGAVFDALRKQAEAKPRQPDRSADIAKARAELDQHMRAAYHYLYEFGKEINSIGPTSGKPYEFLYVGRMPSVTLSDARVENRVKYLEGKDCYDHIMVRFKVTPDPAHKTTLLGEDISRGEQYLRSLRADFETRVQAKNDFGKPTRAFFTVKGKLPCEIDIRADYDKMAVNFELTNVRRLGRTQCRAGISELKDLADELARYVLGVDEDFEKVLRRK